jgi:hypothetical protein
MFWVYSINTVFTSKLSGFVSSFYVARLPSPNYTEEREKERKRMRLELILKHAFSERKPNQKTQPFVSRNAR